MKISVDISAETAIMMVGRDELFMEYNPIKNVKISLDIFHLMLLIIQNTSRLKTI